MLPGYCLINNRIIASSLASRYAVTMENNNHQAGKVWAHSLLSLSLIVAGYFAKAGTNVLLARLLGAAIYGRYSYVLSVLGVLSTFTLLGNDTAVKRFVPEYVSSNRLGYLLGYLIQAVSVTFALSFVLMVVGSFSLAVDVVIRQTILKVEHFHPTVFAFWLVPLITITTLFGGFLRSRHRLFSAIYPVKLMPYLVLLFVLLLDVRFKFSLNLHEVLIVYAFGLFVAIGMQTIAVYFAMPKGILEQTPHFLFKKWTVYGGQFLLASFTFMTIKGIDIILLAWLATKKVDVGYFSAILTLAAAIFMFGQAASIVFSPLISPLIYKDDKKKLQQLSNYFNLFNLVLSVSIGLIFIFFGSYFLNLFGVDFVSVYPEMLLVIFSAMFCVATNASCDLLLYADQQKALVVINMATLLLTIILDVLLIPSYSVWGAAVAFAAGRFMNNTLSMAAVRIKLGIRSWFII